MRCDGGNQQLAFKLAEAIGANRIRMGNPVADIQLANNGVSVRLANGEQLEADVAVLTVPPSAWEHFNITPALPDNYRIATGPAIKYLSKVLRPFWKDDGLGPSSLSDTPVGHTWEGTDGLLESDDETACLTVFSGGNPAQQCLDFPTNQRKERFGKYLEALYPGFRKNFQKGMFMGWPNEKWTQCGYSQAGLGQATTVWPNFWKGYENKLFFAGEYASWKFTGFMEGGLHSGAVLARNLAKKLNLPTN